MSYANIMLEKSDGIATLTLNRPDKLNAFTNAMEVEMFDALQQVRQDKTIRVLVITGAGKAFCAGADFEGMFQELIDRGGLSPDQPVETEFREFPPTIAAINGHAIGAGLTLVLQCDIRIAVEDAKMSLPFVHLGVIPENGSTYYLSRLVGLAKACELIFTGKIITANEAETIGLVNEVVSKDQLMDVTYSLARTIAKAAPLALMMAKKGIYNGLETGVKDAVEFEKSALMALLRSDDHQEAVKAYIEKRPPVFQGK
jgi:2-(1,2-epoxy-1,2-dihydrophenyl)acetyl-CoA isomerase